MINIDRYGNTTAATIPLALNDAVKDGRLKKGSLVLVTSSVRGSRSARCYSLGPLGIADCDCRLSCGLKQRDAFIPTVHHTAF